MYSYEYSYWRYCFREAATIAPARTREGGSPATPPEGFAGGALPRALGFTAKIDIVSKAIPRSLVRGVAEKAWYRSVPGMPLLYDVPGIPHGLEYDTSAQPR